MFEKILQPHEVVEVQEECVYCGAGAMAAMKNGYAILTDKRFVICKKKYSALVIALSVAIFAVIYIGIALLTNLILGALPAMLLGAGSFAAATALSKLFSKNTEKAPDSIDIFFNREDIVSLEEGSRGVRKMLVLTNRHGTVCKISTKNKEQWQNALKL